MINNKKMESKLFLRKNQSPKRATPTSMIKSQNKSKKLNQQEISKEKFNLEEVPKKLLEITKKTNKFEAFVDSITLLHQASMCADLILKICVDQYSSLPDENIIEAAPLLLDALTRFKGIISFDELYTNLFLNGRETEIWRFISSFELSLSMLSHFRECKLTNEQILKLLKMCSTEDTQYLEIILEKPELAVNFYELFRKDADPFIVAILNNLTPDQMKQIHKMIQKSGTNLEQILAEKLNMKFELNSVQEPYYLLDRAKKAKDWEQAAEIAQKLGLDDDYIKFTSLSTSLSDLQAHLLKERLNSEEQKNIITDFAKQLSSANDDQTYSQFSNLASSIAERIDKETDYIQKKREEDIRMIKKFLGEDQKREDMNYEEKEKLKEKETIKVSLCDKCTLCGRQLGHNQVAIFPCGHSFHVDCLKDLTIEISGKAAYIETMPPDAESDCPLCGLYSGAYVHLPLNNASFTPEFWSLKI